MRVLVSVDASVNDVVLEALGDLGLEILECQDPVEAVGTFIMKPFEMFVCDLRKSDTGVEVAGTMKRMDGGKNLKVIFLVRDRAQTDVVQGRVTGAFDVAVMLRDPIKSEDIVKAFDRVSPPKRTATGDISGSWPVVGDEPEAPKDRPLTQREKTRQLIIKLRRERDRVDGAPAHEILRLGPDPSRSDVEEARRTLKRKYLKVVKSDDLPAEARQMAAGLAQLVDHAYVELSASGPRKPKQHRLVTDEERLVKYLEHARELVESGEWDKADKLLAQARLLKQDDPLVLALAGWCRYHNPGLDKEKREEHAKDLLMMAEQFDPHQFDCQYFLAQFFQEAGELENAWRRIVRATRANGEHQGAKNLLQKIKRLGGKTLMPEEQVV